MCAELPTRRARAHCCTGWASKGVAWWPGVRDVCTYVCARTAASISLRLPAPLHPARQAYGHRTLPQHVQDV